MSVVERLRALEKKYETRLANWTREHDHCATEWNYAHRRQCSDIVDDLRALLAELGQEAGAGKCEECGGFGEVCLAGRSAHPSNWHRCEACRPSNATSPAHTSEARDASSILAWAVERWHAEVSQRPLVNVHRRSLDDCWRQVVRRCGEDDVVLLGPRHDDLVAAMRQEGGE